MINIYKYGLIIFSLFSICCNNFQANKDFKKANFGNTNFDTLKTKRVINNDDFNPFEYQQLCFRDMVEGFYDEEIRKTILIYERPNGLVIDSLQPLDDDYWYKITIQKIQNSWIKIDNIWVLCDEKNELNRDIYKFKDCWIKCENIFVDLLNDGSKIYAEPDENSKFIKHDFATAKIIDVYKSWAKIEIIENDGITKGWIKKTEQCPLPYTTCNFE